MKLIFNFLFALLIFGPLASFGVPAVPVAGAVSVLGHFVKAPANSLLMAVSVEIWAKDIIGNLFKENSFLAYAFNADQHVMAGKFVHIPKAGSKPNVEKNRTQLPAVVKVRTDSDILYMIDEYTTDPILIENADEAELSYDKRQSVLAEHQEVLNEVVADWMIYNWFTYTINGTTTTGQIIRTTGAAIAAHLDAVNGGAAATGNRKKLLAADLRKARKTLNKANIAKNNRFAMIDSDMYEQLLDDSELKDRHGEKGGEANYKEGVIIRFAGFNIIERSTVLRFTNAATPVAMDPDAVSTTADNAGALCWQQNAVERAKGDIEFFDDKGNPVYYGDIYSALVRVGGRIRREKGVLAIVQEAAA